MKSNQKIVTIFRLPLGQEKKKYCVALSNRPLTLSHFEIGHDVITYFPIGRTERCALSVHGKIQEQLPKGAIEM